MNKPIFEAGFGRARVFKGCEVQPGGFKGSGEAGTADQSNFSDERTTLVGAIADSAKESLIVRGPDGRISLWNRASEELYAIPARAAIGQSTHTLLKSRHSFGIERLERQLLTDDRWEGEVYRTAADGRELRVEVRWAVQRDAAGDILAILEWGRDLTASDADGQEADTLAHRYRNLFHAMAASFWELDFSEVRRKVGALVASGVTDLDAYFSDHPEFVDECIAATVILDVNETTVEMFGAPSREAILELPLGWEWPAESRRYYAAAVGAAAMGAERYVAELKLHRWDGSLMDALFTVCWPSEHRARGSVLVGVIDISDRKQMERDLRESEVRYRDLFAFMPVALCELDTSKQAARLAELRAEGIEDIGAYMAANSNFIHELAGLVTITDANSEALRLLEADSVAELRGPIARFWSESPATLERSLAARFAGQSQFAEETVGVTLKGNPFEILFTVAFAPELDRKGVSVVAFVDIGERTRATRALQKSESRYRDLFQQIPVALWRLEPNGMRDILERIAASGVTDLGAYFNDHPDELLACMRGVLIVEVNDAAVALSNATDASQLVGRTSADFWADHPEIFKQSLISRFSGEASFQQEGLMNTPYAKNIDVAFSISYPPSHDLRAISVISTLDIRDRKRAEQRLRHAEADLSHAARVSTLGELAASIAHEVNQPLAAITAFGQASIRFLDRPEPDLAEVLDLTGQIVEDARRASAIIARIRSMAMNQAPDHADLDLDAVIEEALLIVGREAANHSVRLVAELDRSIPSILGDRVQILQVIVNLTLNAVQALANWDGERRVTIMTGHRSSGVVSMTVEDTGPGIAADHLDRLFEGFFTTKEQGMGMGLPICRSIIEAHGGVIRAESCETGARFRIEIPAASGTHPELVGN